MAMSKSQIIAAIAADQGLSKSEVRGVLDALTGLVILQLRKSADGERISVLPGALKIYKKYVPAKRARKGVNPFTGEVQMFKAKPASYRVKATVLSKLKDQV